ncbi:Poly(A)+ RNA export protein rae1 [Ascosphaera acerosa]|nr:Poly(A)+ RNA export protein rae1 [Ascosphaera acerosa]
MAAADAPGRAVPAAAAAAALPLLDGYPFPWTSVGEADFYAADLSRSPTGVACGSAAPSASAANSDSSAVKEVAARPVPVGHRVSGLPMFPGHPLSWEAEALPKPMAALPAAVPSATVPAIAAPTATTTTTTTTTTDGSNSTSAASTAGDLSRDVPLASPPDDSVSDIAFAPLSEHIAVASWDGKVRVYQYDETGHSEGRAFFEHHGPVLNCCWSVVGSLNFNANWS